jgi:basic membrane protein A
MKTNMKYLIVFLVTIGMVLTSCGPQATATPTQPVVEKTTAPVVPTQVVEIPTATIEPTPTPVPLKVCFFYSSSVNDQGWSTAQDRGRLYLEANVPNVTTTFVDSISDTGGADVEKVLNDFINQGCKVIVGTSFGYTEAIYNVAVKNPNIIFLNESDYKTAPNIQSHYLRIYDGFYLAGALAGKMTKSKIVGIVATFPMPTILDRVNGFALGVQSVVPDAVVKVVWTQTWLDPGKEKTAADALHAAGADVIQHMSSGPSVIQAGEAGGYYTIGYENDQSAFGPNSYLSSMMLEWGPLYANSIKAIQNGTWKGSTFYVSIQDGVMDIGAFGKSVPQDVQQYVLNLRDQLKSGELAIWKGPIKDQSGEVRIADGYIPTSAELQKTDYLVQGVEGSIPK